ncbi:MAG: hypothetical protein OEY81_03235 [Candidatus Bathyarchaeota archaeon]|nr:hypothetical protein [Aigarchaeota archaeon]MDH5690428.1 hypothetical protein [Candidatus Bathyarchaeota archaeon]
MATINKKWLIIIGASVIVLVSAAYALYRPQVASFSIQVTPAQIEDAVAGQSCVFLVVVADEGEGIGKGAAVDISATTSGSAVTVDPQAITPGQVAEVTVIPDETSANSTLTVTITGEREGSKQTETSTINVWEGLAGPLEEGMGPLAAEIRDKFIPWLAVSHPEFGITDETEWTGTIVRPHIQVVMFYLFFSDDWEMGVSWHVTIEPHNWARIYLRHRFTEVRPSHTFELSSWSAEDYEISAIDPKDAFAESVWR